MLPLILIKIRSSVSSCHISDVYSTSQFEVDLIIGNKLAIEIKGTDFVHNKHLKGLRALREEGIIQSHAVVSCDSTLRETEDGITIYPWHDFLSRLWEGKIL